MNESPPVLENTIQYQISRKECIRQMMRIFLGPSMVLTLGVVFLFGVLLLACAHPGNRPGWAWIFVGFPVPMVFFLSRNARKIVDEHPEFLEPHTVSFDAEGVTFTNSVSRVYLTWQRILQVTEKAGFFVLRCGSFGAGRFIPTRAFTPGQRERFLSFAGTKAKT
jgi:hypothetical protein